MNKNEKKSVIMFFLMIIVMSKWLNATQFYFFHASLSISSTDATVSATSLSLDFASVACSVSSLSSSSSSFSSEAATASAPWPGNFVGVVPAVDGFGLGVVVVMTGTISHFLPLKPDGHSHLNKPSSLVNDVHFPPFKHVFGFSSQYFNSGN